MRISIAGFTGVGKTTIADILSKKLGVPHICFSFKEEAQIRGITLMELQQLAAQDEKIDIEFDNRQKQKMSMHSDFVTSTWLGPWFANAELNIWLYADDTTRAQRVAKRDNVDIETAFKNMLLRDQQNRERYMRLYKIDISDLNMFDICINAAKYSPEEICNIIISVYDIKMGKR